MGDATVDPVDVFVDAWKAWSARPGDERSAKALGRAAHDLAGEQATSLIDHVQRRVAADADYIARVRSAVVEFMAAEHGSDAA